MNTLQHEQKQGNQIAHSNPDNGNEDEANCQDDQQHDFELNPLSNFNFRSISSFTSSNI